MEEKTTVQAIFYLLKISNQIKDKLSIIKLLFFADRYHLRKFGRLITDDTYYAMQKGPVPSAAKEILNCSESDEIYDYFNQLICRKDEYKFFCQDFDPELDLLSESDKEALEFSIENFGHLAYYELVELTHKFPEWLRYKKAFDQSATKREPIIMNDFFEPAILENKDPFDIIPPKVVSFSKEIYNGFF